jgi:probable HAF family extracellular repeat protein
LNARKLNLGLALLIASPLCGEPVYSILNLGGLGGTRSEGFTINAGGVTAGVSRSVGQSSDLPVLYDGARLHTLGASSGQVNGLNNSGTAVGTTYGDSGTRATVWSEAGETLLPTLGGAESYGLAISNAGNVVGSSFTSGGAAHAFLSLADSLVDLGTLGGGWSSAYGVNDELDVVGYSMTSRGTFRAFSWSSETGMIALPTLGGANSYAFGINGGGSIVGVANNPAGYNRAFLYQDGAMQSLGTLGGHSSFAYGINSPGHVVGYSYDSHSRSRAFVWINGVMFDLNSLAGNLEGWTLDAAYGINDSGQIVGSGTYQGAAAAFRLDPLFVQVTEAARAEAVPEPSAGVLAFGALFLLWLGRSRLRGRRY